MLSTITFSKKDYRDIDKHQDNPMVIFVGMANCNVKHNLIDQGSSTDIMFDEA